jgi:hypothetical protein
VTRVCDQDVWPGCGTRVYDHGVTCVCMCVMRRVRERAPKWGLHARSTPRSLLSHFV